MRTTLNSIIVGMTLCALAGVAGAQPAKPAPPPEAPPVAQAHTAMAPRDIKWVDGPPVFPKGMKMTVLYGDPSKPGELFIIRAKLPARYKIMPHTHPTTENVTIVSGAAAIGMGDTVDPKTKALGPGSFYSLPAGMHHYFFTTKASIIDVAAVGPFAITYINPADDPSKAVAPPAPGK